MDDHAAAPARYFAGAGRRATSTLRGKLQKIDGYYHFLEQRYAGEIARRLGVAVESPVDPFNRPVHRGDFGLRIPPKKRATKEFFVSWRSSLPDARKPVCPVLLGLLASGGYAVGSGLVELPYLVPVFVFQAGACALFTGAYLRARAFEHATARGDRDAPDDGVLPETSDS